MVTKISTFQEWAEKRRECSCNKELSVCIPAKSRRVCVDCYEDYVTNCLSQSRYMQSSIGRG